MLRTRSVPSSLVRLFGAFLPLAVMLPAQSVGDWRPIESTVVPPPRTGYSMAGSLNGATFLIGGDSANANALDYVWSGTGWTPFSTPIAPRRDNSAFALYGEHGTMLYGGSAAGAWLGDAYLMDVNGVFTQIAGPPNVLADPSLAYEADGDRMVLVGRNAQGFYETHFYSDGSGWSAGPSFAVADARVVGDTVRGEALLFTSNFGLLDVAALADDTWQYLASTPTLTALGELAFDPRRGRVVLVQPYSDRATLEWDGLRFHAVTASSGSYVPPAATAMAFDRRRGEMLYVANYGAGVETFRHVAEPGASWLAFGSSCGFYGGTIRVAAGEPVPGTWHRLEADLPAGSLALSVLGLSRTSAGGVSLPLLIQFCYLRVDPAVVTVLGTSTGTASQMIWLPNQASLLGELYDAQFLQVDGTGALVAGSPGLEVQVGATTGEQAVVESFDTEARRDPLASGDRWVAGEVAKVAIGGDGLHGSFDPALGVQVEPGVYEFSTDLMTIPADRTLSGANEQVTNGRFYFTDFVVPAGVAVRFVGSNPATVFVRGMVEVHGEVSVDAPDMPAQLVTSGPASGQRISSFQARSGPVLYTYTPGQPGGAGGAGGAPGGDGGDECQNAGPVVVNGVDVTSGQPGGDVRVAAGHAFAASVAGTGGAGSTLMPPTGVWASSVPLLQYIYCGYFSPGGGGGGFATFGGMAVAPTHNSPSLTITTGAIANGGNPFPIAITPPAGHTSLEHFSVGGAGGGGGGSHGYGLLGIGAAIEKWMAGHGGSGGGGALALRSGGSVEIRGRLSARGGDGPVINGDDPAATPGNGQFGISSPGGGGSGGSVLVQSGFHVTVGNGGTVDVSGGLGGRVGFITNTLLANSGGHGGDGAAGLVRVEEPLGTAFFAGLVTPSSALRKLDGTLTDSDEVTGSRSTWLLPSSADLPIYLRYELVARIGNQVLFFSDDPNVAPIAADDLSTGVRLRFQGARKDPVTGQPITGSEGPWRDYVRIGPDSLNGDRADLVRFDLLTNRAAGQVEVLELRIVYR